MVFTEKRNTFLIFLVLGEFRLGFRLKFSVSKKKKETMFTDGIRSSSRKSSYMNFLYKKAFFFRTKYTQV